MKKQLVHEKIYSKSYDGSLREIPLGDLPTGLLPTDTIIIVYDDGFVSENESCNASTELRIYRHREETDDEYNERVAWWEKKKEESRKARYEDYLKLKKEFEEGLLTRHGYKMSPEEKKHFDDYSDMKFNTYNDDESEESIGLLEQIRDRELNKPEVENETPKKIKTPIIFCGLELAEKLQKKYPHIFGNFKY